MLKLLNAVGGVEAREAAEVADPNQRARPMFLGYPVTFSQVYPSTEANSQVPVTLGDHSRGIRYGDWQGTSVLFSETASVGRQSMFERNQIGVRAFSSFDVVVHDGGDNTTAGPIVAIETAAS